MLDFLGELGTLPAWFYRGWAFLLFKDYRDERKYNWKKRGLIYKIFDIGISLIFMIIELLLLYATLKYFLNK